MKEEKINYKIKTHKKAERENEEQKKKRVQNALCKKKIIIHCK